MGGSLKSKTVIVTGGAMGIGKSVAMRLADENANVVIVDIDDTALADTAHEISSKGKIVLPIKADIRHIPEIQQVVDTVVKKFGSLDILVNVAGVMKSVPFLDISPDEWNRVIDVNLRGTFFFIQAAAAQMISQIPEHLRSCDRSESSNGKIVNFSSISGRRGRAIQAHYAATKAGVISLTQSAALAFAQYNINVNAVAPSVVLTPMWEKNNLDKSKIFGISSDKASQEFIERIPLKRSGSGLDMAEAVLFLCSNKSDYITGQTLNVDGGFEMD